MLYYILGCLISLFTLITYIKYLDDCPVDEEFFNGNMGTISVTTLLSWCGLMILITFIITTSIKNPFDGFEFQIPELPTKVKSILFYKII